MNVVLERTKPTLEGGVYNFREAFSLGRMLPVVIMQGHSDAEFNRTLRTWEKPNPFPLSMAEREMR